MYQGTELTHPIVHQDPTGFQSHPSYSDATSTRLEAEIERILASGTLPTSDASPFLSRFTTLPGNDDDDSSHSINTSISSTIDISCDAQTWQFHNFTTTLADTSLDHATPDSSSFQSDLLPSSARAALWTTIIQDSNAHSSYQQLVYRNNEPVFITRRSDADALSTTTNCPSIYSNGASQETPPLDLPLLFYVDNIPQDICRRRTYYSYPSDDSWSVSSVTSNSTVTTQASTITSTSIDYVTGPESPYHNPRFLGNLHYYLPPRLLPLPADGDDRQIDDNANLSPCA